MARFAAHFDVAAAGAVEASAVVADATAIEASAAALKAVAAARAAEDGAYRSGGGGSPVEELADTLGVGRTAARELLSTGSRLREQPALAAAATAGTLSPAKVALVANASAADPAAASRLIGLAGTSSLAALREECARVKASAGDPEARRRAIRARRALHAWTDVEGVWRLTAQGNPEDGAQVMAALAPRIEERFHAARAAGERESPAAYAFDALIALGREAASADGREPDPGPRERAGGEATPDRFAGGGGDVGSGGDAAPDPFSGGGCLGSGGSAGADRHPAGSGNGARSDGPVGEGRTGAEPAGDRGDPHPSRGSGTGWPGAPPAGDDGEGRRQAGDSGQVLDTGGAAAAGAGRGRDPERPDRPPGRRRRRGAPVKLLVRIDYDTFLRGVAREGETCELVGYGPIAVSAVRDLLETGDPFVAAILTKAKAVVGVAHLGRKANAHQLSALQWLYPTCAVRDCVAEARLEVDHRRDWAATHFTAFDLLDRLCHRHHALKTRENWSLVDGTGKRDFVPPSDPRHPRHASAPACA